MTKLYVIHLTTAALNPLYDFEGDIPAGDLSSRSQILSGEALSSPKLFHDRTYQVSVESLTWGFCFLTGGRHAAHSIE